MSQSSILLDSFQHSRSRFGKTASGAVNVLHPKRHITLQHSAFPIKRQITSTSTVAFDSEILFKLPASGFVHGMALRSVLADTTTADYSDYPGAVITDEVEFRSDNEILHQYKYPPVFNYYLSKLKSEEARDKVLLATGGVNTGLSGPITVMTPIPTFFDPVLNKGARPLNLSRFKKAPELIIKTRTLANSVKPTSTGGAISSMVLVLYISDTSINHKRAINSVEAWHNAPDFATNEKNVVVTATQTFIDVSGFNGLNTRFLLTNRLVSEVDTNKQYYVQGEIGELKTRLDGHEEYVFRTKEEGELDFIYYGHGKGFNSTIGYPYIVPWGYAHTPDYLYSNTGGLHSSRVNKSEVGVTHALGANSYIDVLAVKQAIFKYKDGGMVRLL